MELYSKTFIDTLIDIIKEAGNIIKDSMKYINIIEEKGIGNFVTESDIKVEKFLIFRLHEITPTYKVISEESNRNEIIHSDYFWIIDPIDGTTNLIHNYPSICISLALVNNRNTLLGIVYDPFMDEMFFSMLNRGTFLNGDRVNVSSVDTLNKSLIAYGLPYNRSRTDTIFNATKRVFSSCHDLKRKGPASLDLAYVACGRIDAYFELDLELWDFSAGKLILEEAGGVITNWKGDKLSDSNSKQDILATNGLLHYSLVKNLIL